MAVPTKATKVGTAHPTIWDIMSTLKPSVLESFASQLLHAGGTSAEEAKIVAASLVDANLKGYDSHGVMRVPYYVQAIKDAEVVFVGHGIVAPEFQWNDYAGADVKGKVVMAMVNDPPATDAEPALFGGQALTYYGRWTYKFEEGARKGAAAIFVIHETGPAGYPFAVVQGNLGEKFDLVTPDKNMSRASIEGWITLDAAKKILQLGGQNFDELKTQARTREFKPVPLGLKASMAVKNKLRTVDSQNVVAKLEGSDPALKDEYVVYSAHWDHLGVGDPDPDDKSDTIYNGALDNASGVASLLEIARAFTQVKPAPRRSILFLMVTAEEQGLLGSEYYAVTPIYPLAKTVANINLDGFNQWGRTKDITVIGIGVYYLVKAVTGKFEKELEHRSVGPLSWSAIRKMGVVGWIGRAAMMGLIGVFLVRAAIQFDPNEARGLDDSLRRIADHPFGVLTVLVVAVGLIVYGAFCIVTVPSQKVVATDDRTVAS